MENTAFALAQATAGDPAAERFLADYEIGELLGIGAFSEVRAAVDKRTGQHVAIKVIDKQHSREDNVSVDVEIAILKRVRHPNVIALFDVHEGMAKIFLVMELVTGGELFDRIVDKGRFTETDAARIVRKILEAVHYLHEAGIAHRDLKPENLLLSDPSDQARVMISDFGLSKMMSNEELMKTACGTPGYVAPEVLSYVGYGKEVDLWSTGVIAYVLLCGYAPFFGEKDAELFAAIMGANFEFDSPYWDNISKSAKDFISKLLVVDSRKRLSSSQALQHPWIKNSVREGEETEVNLQPAFKSHLYNHPTSKKPVDVRSVIDATVDMQRQAASGKAQPQPQPQPPKAAAVAPAAVANNSSAASSPESSPGKTKKVIGQLSTVRSSGSITSGGKQGSSESLNTNSNASSASSLSSQKGRKQTSSSSLHDGNNNSDRTGSIESHQQRTAAAAAERKMKPSYTQESFVTQINQLGKSFKGLVSGHGSGEDGDQAEEISTALPSSYFAYPGVEEGKTIRILSYNIFVRPPLIKNNLSDYKDARLAYFIEHELSKFDIIGLQEMFNYGSNRQERLIEAARKLGFAYVHTSPHRSLLQGKIDGGLVLLSRFPIVKTGVYKFARGVFSDRLIAKGALYARIELAPQRHINVFLAHLQTSALDAENSEELCRLLRQQQLRFLKQFMLDETGSVRAQEPILLLAAMEIDGRVSSESGQDSDEYLTMMEILQGTDGGSPPLTVVDLLKEAYGEHPVMCGDTDEASGQPKETVLTYKELQGIRARYDYAFWVAPPNLSPSTAKIAQTQNNKRSTKVEPFAVTGEKFTQLSDNYGISTAVFLANLRKSTAAVHGSSSSASSSQHEDLNKRSSQASTT